MFWRRDGKVIAQGDAQQVSLDFTASPRPAGWQRRWRPRGRCCEDTCQTVVLLASGWHESDAWRCLGSSPGGSRPGTRVECLRAVYFLYLLYSMTCNSVGLLAECLCLGACCMEEQGPEATCIRSTGCVMCEGEVGPAAGRGTFPFLCEHSVPLRGHSQTHCILSSFQGLLEHKRKASCISSSVFESQRKIVRLPCRKAKAVTNAA
jgi:hypothetical protein